MTSKNFSGAMIIIIWLYMEKKFDHKHWKFNYKFIFDNGNKNANFFSYKQDNNEEMEAYEN
jgi:hypothetical protein